MKCQVKLIKAGNGCALYVPSYVRKALDLEFQEIYNAEITDGKLIVTLEDVTNEQDETETIDCGRETQSITETTTK